MDLSNPLTRRQFHCSGRQVDSGPGTTNGVSAE
jgi:hypothetical protein